MYSDNDYGNDDGSQRRFLKQRKSRTKDFSEADKKKLASLIKKQEHLWDCTNILHSNSGAVDKSWAEISVKMGKAKEKCKLAWTALRESYRYHERTAKIYGDPLGHKKNHWPYSTDLAFLAKAKRVTKSIYPFIETSNDDSTDVTLEQDDPSTQNFIVKEEIRASSELNDYEKDPHEHSSVINMSSESLNSNNEQETTGYDGYTTNGNNEMGNLIKQLGNLVDAQTQFVRHIRGSNTEKLVYQTQLVACDALLQQLPKTIAQTTLVEIQNYILKKINDQQKHKTEMDM